MKNLHGVHVAKINVATVFLKNMLSLGAFQDITELAASFISEAKSMATSLSSIHAIVESSKSIFEKILEDLKNEVNAVSQEANVDSKLFTRLLKKVHSYRNPFSGTETEYAETKYWERTGFYVKPDKYTIDSRPSFVVDSTSWLHEACYGASLWTVCLYR